MLVLRTPSDMTAWSTQEAKKGRSIGFVPTMGALHEGHIALTSTSVLQNDTTVVSIFVNPLQFNNQNDLQTYPRQLATDIDLLTLSNVDVLYAPSAEDMYPGGFATSIDAGDIAQSMEGEHRPGHFNGVATVVVKLLNSVRPDIAYFGMKDFQQLAVIRQVVLDLNLACQIVGAPTVRDEDGLALSSRNKRLSPEHRIQAPIIYKTLCDIASSFAIGNTDISSMKSQFVRIEESTDATVEYFEVVDSATLRKKAKADDASVICVSVWFGDVRLIDNISLARSIA